MTPRYGYRDALREAWEHDPRNFVLALLLVPPACIAGYLWLLVFLVLGGAR